MKDKFKRVNNEELEALYSSVLHLESYVPISVSAGFMRDLIHELKVHRCTVARLGAKAAEYKKLLKEKNL